VTERSVASPLRFDSDADWPAWPSASVVAPHEIHVVRVWLPDAFHRYESEFAILSCDEQARAERFLIERVRQRFVACRATLRRLLADRVGCSPAEIAFAYGEFGKPQLSNAGGPGCWAFNVAHSEDLALIALGTDRALGVDVEWRHDRDWQALGRRFFAAAEWEQLQRLPEQLQQASFYRLWTCKEAYLKATGQGMSLPLGRFTMCADPRLPPRLVDAVDHPGATGRWQIRALDPAADFAAAVMFDGPATTVQCWTW